MCVPEARGQCGCMHGPARVANVAEHETRREARGMRLRAGKWQYIRTTLVSPSLT